MRSLFVLFLMIYSQMSLATYVYNDQTSNYSARWIDGHSIIHINGIEVDEDPVDPKNCTDSHCLYRKKLDDSMLYLGNNNITFKVITNGCRQDGDVLDSTYDQYIISNDNIRIDLFKNLKRHGVCPAKFNISKTIDITLAQIDRNLYESINNAINTEHNDFNTFLKDNQSRETEIAANETRLDDLAKSINECYTIFSNTTDSSSLEKQFSKCANYQKSYDALSALINTKELVSEEERNRFDQGLKDFGNALSAYKMQGISVVSQEKIDEIEKSVSAQIPDKKERKENKVNLISNLFINISDRLEKLFADGKRDEFIQLASYAEDKVNEFSSEIASNNYPYAETQALDVATKSITKTLAKYVDKNLWFNDANIPQETKDAIDNVLANVDQKASIELKAALQNKNAIKSEVIRNGINKALSCFNTLDKEKTEETKNDLESFMSKTANQFVTFIKNDGVCVGSRLLFYEASSLFEVVSGRDFCNIDRELTLSERAFSGLGLIIGSGKFWSKAANKFESVATAIGEGEQGFFSKLMSKFTEAAEKLGVKAKEEVNRFSDFVSKVFKNETGAVGEIERLTESAESGVVKLEKYSINTPEKLESLKRVESNPLRNTEYTKDVKDQMSLGDYHAFPNEVDNWAGVGEKIEITGGDGLKRTKIELTGSYRGNDGHFEWIIEPDGHTVNHRLFVKAVR